MKTGKKLEQLKDIQFWMQNSLINPNINDGSADVELYISATENLSAIRHLAIYQRAYYNRLTECMREQFKALLHTLGNELFDDFSRMYLTENPSASPSLASLGERFPAFLQANRPDRLSPETWVDFMIAMAQFEVDLYRIFDQAGSENDKFADEFTVAENLELQKCFALHQYSFEVNRYYQGVAEGSNPELTPEKKTYIAFVRNNYQVYVISLTEVQFVFLGLLENGKSIAEAIEDLIKQYNLVPEKVAERWLDWKQIWITKGFFLDGK
jgi:hypothetical protein